MSIQKLSRGGNARVLPLFLILIGAGVPEAFGQLPDLGLNQPRTATTLSLEKRYVARNDCELIEGCVRAPGWRTLLRFDVGVVNRGKGDLVLGNPRGKKGWFHYSPCHQHYHFRDLITYELFNARRKLVFRGAKQAFCLRDNYPYMAGAPPSRGYDCDYQGLTAGWEDVYDTSLDCQWLDVTGIRPGVYKMRATVNRNRRLRESNYNNNVIWVKVIIPPGR